MKLLLLSDAELKLNLEVSYIYLDVDLISFPSILSLSLNANITTIMAAKAMVINPPNLVLYSFSLLIFNRLMLYKTSNLCRSELWVLIS